jgi:hypothetical protein
MTKTVKYPLLEWIELVSQGWVTATVLDGQAHMLFQQRRDPYSQFREGQRAVDTLDQFLVRR